MKLRLFALLALCLCLPLSTPGQTATLHSDQHAQAERAALGTADPMAPVYIVTSQATFDAGLKALSTKAAPARDAAGRSLVVAQLRAHQLSEVSRMVHERERRCGGYFAFATRAQALAFVAADRTAQAMRTKALPAYTIDNAATVQPWLAQVDEARIRAGMIALSRFTSRENGSYEAQQAVLELKEQWQALTRGRAYAYTSLLDCVYCFNPQVMLTVRGASKADEIVVVGAHLDSTSTTVVDGQMIAPGADDNASGIATLTEVIRVALAQGWRPQRTVKFVAYAATERGLYGSTALAREHRDANANVVGVLNLDMTNYTAGSTLSMRLVTDFSPTSMQQFVTALFDRYLAPLGMTRGTTSCGYACSDHAAWTTQGYPSAYMREPTWYPERHTPNDTMERVGPNAHSSAKFAKLALAFVGELGKTAKPLTFSDLDGDGRSDVFWRNSATGANDVWRSADARTRIPTATVADNRWTVAAIHDFNGDNRADVLWWFGGRMEIWPGGYAAGRLSVHSLSDSDWQVASVGDFDGNGTADTVLRHGPSGTLNLWPSGNPDPLVDSYLGTVANPDWQIVATGDFDLDRREDILWRNRATGSNELWRQGQPARRAPLTAVTVLAWRVAGTGDFNGDGRADVLWRNASTGANVVWYSANANTQKVLASVADTRWQVAGVGDYNGDGRADILWRHSASGSNDLWLGGNNTQRVALSPVANLDWKVMR